VVAPFDLRVFRKSQMVTAEHARHQHCNSYRPIDHDIMETCTWTCKLSHAARCVLCANSPASSLSFFFLDTMLDSSINCWSCGLALLIVWLWWPGSDSTSWHDHQTRSYSDQCTEREILDQSWPPIAPLIKQRKSSSLCIACSFSGQPTNSFSFVTTSWKTFRLS